MSLANDIEELREELRAIRNRDVEPFHEALRKAMANVANSVVKKFEEQFKNAEKMTAIVAARRETAEALRALGQKLDVIDHDFRRLHNPNDGSIKSVASEVAKELKLERDDMKALDDDAFVKMLEKVKEKAGEEARLEAVLQIVENLSESIDAARERIKSLASRAKADGTIEGQRAIQLKSKIQVVLDALWKRRERAAELFYVERRATLRRIVAQSTRFDKAWPSPSISLKMIADGVSSSIDTPIRLLQDLDDKQRKFREPSTMAGKEAAR